MKEYTKHKYKTKNNKVQVYIKEREAHMYTAPKQQIKIKSMAGIFKVMLPSYLNLLLMDKISRDKYLLTHKAMLQTENLDFLQEEN